jgi:hypothetical protein
VTYSHSKKPKQTKQPKLAKSKPKPKEKPKKKLTQPAAKPESSTSHHSSKRTKK